MQKRELIPTYKLHSFSSPEKRSGQFQVEIFDANRHFQVEYPHRHDFFELLFIEKGSGIHTIDGNSYNIEPPCLFFLSPGQAHKLEISDDIEGYIYIFTSDFYLINRINQNRLIEFPFFFDINQNNPPLLFDSSEGSRFIKLMFQEAVKRVGAPDESTIDMLRVLLDAILVECASLYPTDVSVANSGKGAVLVKRLFNLIEENYLKNYSINEYAAILNVTPGHLTQTVKLLTGKRTSEVLRSKQILEAKRLLIYSELSITEISDSLNFADQSYFSKFFKKEVGVVPSVFRDKSMKST